LQGLNLQMDEFFERLQTPSDEQGREFFVEARYPYQAWELEVPLARHRVDESGDVEALVDAFHAVHTRVFAVSEPGQHVECIYWKARATVRLPAAAVGPVSVDDGAVRDAVHTAPAWFGDRDSQATRQFHGPRMQTGAQISGPAVIQEPTTTVVIYPGWSALVTARGEYLMTREPKAA
jgi:N-methylhydantoinase A